MITKDLFTKFLDYNKSRSWKFDENTSEFTIQFRFARFLDETFPDLYNIELESNIKRHGYELSEFTKKEIDIDLLIKKTKRKQAIEIKFIKDKGSYDIQCYKFCQDIKFLEELRSKDYDTSFAIIFTNLPVVYTRRENNKAGMEKKNLYDCFQNQFCIKGKISFNKDNAPIQFDNGKEYKLVWFGLGPDFGPDFKACIIEV